MECEKCQDVGFIEHNAGLLTEFCNCEKGREILAQKRAIYSIPEEADYGKRVKSTAQASNNFLEIERQVVEKNDSDSGIEQPDTNTGSGNTSEPKQPSKPKKKRKARKRAK